ncbi:MAG: FHA domain-containing protein [Planctomycetota bacterium]
MHYKLVLLDNATAQVRDEWNLVLPASVGRGEDCNIMLNDASVSRQHCRFSMNPYGAVTLQDLGSTNGIYVRNQRVKQAAVTVGETFQIGGMDCKIELVDQPIQERERPAVEEDLYGTQRVEIYEIP